MTHEKNNSKNKTASPTHDWKSSNPPREIGTSCPSLTLDVALYQSYLDDADLTDEQKEQVLTGLWNVIVGFVSLGFGVHPLQQASVDCEDIKGLAELLPLEAHDLIDCEEHSKILNTARGGNSNPPPERSQK